MRSPKCPKKRPPTGLAANPTAKTPRAAIVPTNGSRLGKNSRLKTSEAKKPYSRKSYHSIVVPRKQDTSMRLFGPLIGSRGAPVFVVIVVPSP
jgi:hypothetical protein